PASLPRRPTAFPTRRSSDLFAACARLDNRVELGAALGLAPTDLARTRDAVLILRMMERWGDAGVARCLGAFAFALWDADARRLIDRKSTRLISSHCPLSYAV